MLGFNAATIFVLPWILGLDGYAEFAILSSSLALAVGTFRTPIEVLIQRSFQRDAAGFATFYSLSNLRFIFLLSALTSTLLFFAALYYSGYSTEIIVMALLSLGAMAGVLSGVRRGLLIVSQQTDRVDILDLLARPAFFLVTLVSYKLIAGVNELTMPIILALSFLLVLSVPNMRALLHLFTNTAGSRVGGAPDWIKLVASSLLSALRKNGDVILLANIVGGPIVGSYFLLVRITDLLAFGNNYANIRYTHQFAKAVRNGEGAAIRAIVRAATRLSLTVALIGAVPALMLGPWVLPLIHPDLAGLYLPFAILIGAQVFNGVFGPQGAFLTSQRPGASLAIKTVNSAFGLLLLYVLTVRFGIIGTASAVAISITTANILVAIVFFRLNWFLSQDGA